MTCIRLLGPWVANPPGLSTTNELVYVLASHRDRDRPYIVVTVWGIIRYQSCCRLLPPGATRSSLSILFQTISSVKFDAERLSGPIGPFSRSGRFLNNPPLSAYPSGFGGVSTLLPAVLMNVFFCTIMYLATSHTGCSWLGKEAQASVRTPLLLREMLATPDATRRPMLWIAVHTCIFLVEDHSYCTCAVTPALSDTLLRQPFLGLLLVPLH